MRFPKLKKGDWLTVWWQDTYDPKLNSWADDDEIMEAIKKEDTIAESIGSFYCEYGGHIYIYGDKLDKHSSRLTGIPKGCIIKVKKEKK
jgi:hypothetical protein